MVFGCLLGVFLPVLVKHKELLGGEGYHQLVSTYAWIQMFLLFASVFLAGVPYEWAFVASSVCLGIVIFCLCAFMLIFAVIGSPVFLKAGLAVAKEVAAGARATEC